MATSPPTVGDPSAEVAARAISPHDANRCPGLFANARADDGIDRRREPGECLSDGWGWVLEVGADQRRRDLPAKRRRAGQALEEHAAERVLVGAPVEGLALELLGCGVVEGAGEPRRAERAVAVQSPGQTEVGEVGVAVVGDQHVARLDVAVDEAAGVRSVEGGGDLVDDRQRPAGSSRPSTSSVARRSVPAT